MCAAPSTHNPGYEIPGTIQAVEKVVIRAVGSPKQSRNAQKSRLKHHKSGSLKPLNRGTKRHEGVFQQAQSFPAVSRIEATAAP
jgi:hypothetical protein